MATLTIGGKFTPQAAATDLGAFKVLAKNRLLTSREIARIEPVLREHARALDANERRRWERLGGKIADQPIAEQHAFRDGLVQRVR